MEHSVMVLMVAAFLVLAVAAGLDFGRRQFTRKRNDYRMGQALRRGFSQPGGPWTQSPQVVEWQSCENTSVPWS